MLLLYLLQFLFYFYNSAKSVTLLKLLNLQAAILKFVMFYFFR